MAPIGTPRRLAILGASGNALDVLDIVAALNAAGSAWQVIGMFDDAAGSSFAGIPVLGPLAVAGKLSAPGARLAGTSFMLAVGSDQSHAKRASILARTGLSDINFATLVHPAAAVSDRATLGQFTVSALALPSAGIAGWAPMPGSVPAPSSAMFRCRTLRDPRAARDAQRRRARRHLRLYRQRGGGAAGPVDRGAGPGWARCRGGKGCAAGCDGRRQSGPPPATPAVTVFVRMRRAAPASADRRGYD